MNSAGKFLRRATDLHAATWLAMLAVFALFMWLNFNTTRVSYLEKAPGGWRGGVREGFPLPWWDAGMEASGALDDGALVLSSKPYGGWQTMGVCTGLFVLGVAFVLTA